MSGNWMRGGGRTFYACHAVWPNVAWIWMFCFVLSLSLSLSRGELEFTGRPRRTSFELLKISDISLITFVRSVKRVCRHHAKYTIRLWCKYRKILLIILGEIYKTMATQWRKKDTETVACCERWVHALRASDNTCGGTVVVYSTLTNVHGHWSEPWPWRK